jgi:hypothetical protein
MVSSTYLYMYVTISGAVDRMLRIVHKGNNCYYNPKLIIPRRTTYENYQREAIVEIDDEDNLVSVRAGEDKMSIRPDDGVPGKIKITCQNGHEGYGHLPPIVATLTAKARISFEAPCPLCGGTVSARGGYYQRNEDGVFERLSGMPS